MYLTALKCKKNLFLVPAVLVWLLCVSCAQVGLFKQEDDPGFAHPFVEHNYPGDEHFITVDNVKVCYVNHAKPEGKHTLIFLHGLSLSIDNFRFNYPYFFDNYHVVALDFPGFGKSEFPDVSYSIDYFTKYVAHFMDRLGIKKATLIGNSLGAEVALQFALEYPDRVEALVIGSATGIRRRLGVLEDIMIDWYITENRFLNLSEKKMREDIEWSWHHTELPACRELVRYRITYRRAYAGTETYTANNRAFVRGLLHVIKDSIRDKVKDVNAPSLIVWGEHDQVTKLSDAYFLHKNIKGSELAIIKDAGHLAHIEQPQAYNQVVEAFLKNHLEHNPSQTVLPSEKEPAQKK